MKLKMLGVIIVVASVFFAFHAVYMKSQVACTKCSYSTSISANYCASCGHYLRSIETVVGSLTQPIAPPAPVKESSWIEYVPFVRDVIGKSFFDLSAWKLSILLAIILSIALALTFAAVAERGFSGELETMIHFFFWGTGILSVVFRVILY